MKIILLIIILLAGGFFGYKFYNSKIDNGIKATIESQAVQDAQPLNGDSNTNQEYKAYIYSIKVTNKSDSEFTLLPSEYFRLKSGNNYYELSPDAGVENPLQGGVLGIGQSTSGQIGFYAIVNRNAELQFRTSTDGQWQKL